VVPNLRGARSLYLPDQDAFMPRFAATVIARPERRVITVAHYDATLLAYYVARAQGLAVDWSRLRHQGDSFHVDGDARLIDPLVQVHRFDSESEPRALARLEASARLEPVLVVDRDALKLDSIRGFLSRCELIDEAPAARLYACGDSK
jgi:hypothetical protein